MSEIYKHVDQWWDKRTLEQEARGPERQVYYFERDGKSKAVVIYGGASNSYAVAVINNPDVTVTEQPITIEAWQLPGFVDSLTSEQNNR